MTAVADLITRADRDRLLKRLAEWRDLDGAMRKPGGLAALPPPTPLHKMGERPQNVPALKRRGSTNQRSDEQNDWTQDTVRG